MQIFRAGVSLTKLTIKHVLGSIILLSSSTKSVLSSLFWVKNFFKIINLFAIFASEDGKPLLSCLYMYRM